MSRAILDRSRGESRDGTPSHQPLTARRIRPRRGAARPAWRAALRLTAALIVLALPADAFAQRRRVTFPPAESPPPPAAKPPEKTQTSAEETDVLPGAGLSMRKTQERTPPPPTNLTIMYKVVYGETLEYVHPDGTVQKFEQWKSFDGDAHTLVNSTNHRLADGNNYQYAVKPLASPGFDPVDIPILFMAGDYDFVLRPAEVENLRTFITSGGTIIFNAARGRDEFSDAVVREMGRVFPTKKMTRLSPDHPVFNSRYRINQVLTLADGVQLQQAPEVYSIDIGTRAAAILVPGGMGASWQGVPHHPAGRHIVGESATRLGVNLIAYVLGSTEYGKFLAQEFPVYAGKTRPGDVLRFPLVRYAGSWDDNPAIQNTALQSLHDMTGVHVDYTPVSIALDDPALGNHPLVFMSGHHEFRLSREEAAGLSRYLHRGGMLVATASAGLKPFDVAFRREIKRLFPKADLVKLPPSHPVFVSGWSSVERVAYTPAALRDNPTLEHPEFWGLFIDDRLAVLYSPWDLLSGVNRESNAYAKGIAPDDAVRVLNNLVTHALTN